MYQKLKTGGLLLTDYEISENYYCHQISDLEKMSKTPAIVTGTSTILDFTKLFPNNKLVYLASKSMEILGDNMRKKGDSEANISKRLSLAKLELNLWEKIKPQVRIQRNFNRK